MPNWDKFIKPERVDFKEGWDSEAEFDAWLVAGDGLSSLGDVIGIDFDLENVRQQESVGRYAADIFTKDSDGKAVLIENQRGDTDHDHLGKILTYAGGLTGDTAGCQLIWISENVRDEHRAAIDWLNARTDTGNNFFALEIGLLQVEGNLMPTWTVVCQPNDWSRTNRSIARGDLSNAESKRWEFWTQMLEYFDGAEIKTFKRKSASSDHWLNAGAGVSGFSWSLNFLRDCIRVSLHLDAHRELNKFVLQRLEAQRNEIEEAFGAPLSWRLAPEKKSSGIIYEKKVKDSYDEACWDGLNEWLAKYLQKLEQATKERLLGAKAAWDAGERDDLSEEDT